MRDAEFFHQQSLFWLQAVVPAHVHISVLYRLHIFSVHVLSHSNWLHSVQLDQASLSLSREYLVKGLDEKLVAALYSYMVDIATMFGADRDRAKTELKESLKFEIMLANVSITV